LVAHRRRGRRLVPRINQRAQPCNHLRARSLEQPNHLAFEPFAERALIVADVIDFKTRRKQQHAEEERKDLLAAADEFLDQNPMWEVLSQGVYWMRKENGKPIAVKPAHMGKHFPQWQSPFPVAITACLSKRGWTYRDVTYSFRPDVPKDTLNLVDMSRWVQPVKGEHHWLFDVLMKSLCGGKQEAICHLEHVLTYKYVYPETYTLPAIFFHGQGGTGKNRLVNGVLKTLFGGQTMSMDAKNAIGEFNSLLPGLAIAMIDEGTTPDTNEKVKQTVGNEFLIVNPKGVIQFEADNTPLYIISSNATGAGLFLDRSDADRRYSVIHVDKHEGVNEKMNTLNYHIAVHMKWIPEGTTGDALGDAAARAFQWMHDKGNKILTDKVEISYWLDALINRHSGKGVPSALHGEHFQRLMDIQETVGPRIIEAVFNDPDFTHINRTVLYKGYRMLSLAYGYKPERDGKFFATVESWLKANKPHIRGDRIRQKGSDARRLFVNTDRDENVWKRSNDVEYMSVDDRGKLEWKGPEI
jgi:hypothetical protein